MGCRKKTILFVLILAAAALSFPTGCNRAADSKAANQEISSSMTIPDYDTAGSTVESTVGNGNAQTAPSEPEKEEVKKGALFSEDELGSIANGKAILADDLPCQRCWAPKDQQAVLSKVASWLRQAQTYTDKIPESCTGIFNANFGPAVLSITTADHHTIAINPASYLTSSTISSNGKSYEMHYVANVLKLSKDGQSSYIQSAELYDWLKNDNWKTEFKQK